MLCRRFASEQEIRDIYVKAVSLVICRCAGFTPEFEDSWLLGFVTGMAHGLPDLPGHRSSAEIAPAYVAGYGCARSFLGSVESQ